MHFYCNELFYRCRQCAVLHSFLKLRLYDRIEIVVMAYIITPCITNNVKHKSIQTSIEAKKPVFEYHNQHSNTYSIFGCNHIRGTRGVGILHQRGDVPWSRVTNWHSVAHSQWHDVRSYLNANTLHRIHSNGPTGTAISISSALFTADYRSLPTTNLFVASDRRWPNRIRFINYSPPCTVRVRFLSNVASTRPNVPQQATWRPIFTRTRKLTETTYSTARNHETKNKKSQSNLGKAASPPLTAENNYATKSPLVTMGCPTFTSKTTPFPSPISAHSSLDRPHSPPETASRSNQPFFHRSPTWQTDRQTDRPTDELSNNAVPTPAYALLYW